MNALETVFGKSRVVTPVIHVQDYKQLSQNLKVAQTSGADGVWLINHDGSSSKLLELCAQAIAEFGPFWIGGNFLGWGPYEALGEIGGFKRAGSQRSPSVPLSGLWTDNALIDERTQTQGVAAQVAEAKASITPTLLYFGGVAFKYQRPVSDLITATELAVPYMDVITTSGAGTGQAADVQKLATMHAAAKGHPIGIASGITPENVNDYLPYVNAFLVASGINRAGDFYNLDPGKTKALVDAVGEYVHRAC